MANHLPFGQVRYEGLLLFMLPAMNSNDPVVSLPDLEGKVRDLFKTPLGPLSLSYQDIEGGDVTMLSDKDVEDALVGQGLNPLCITVKQRVGSVSNQLQQPFETQLAKLSATCEAILSKVSATCRAISSTLVSKLDTLINMLEMKKPDDTSDLSKQGSSSSLHPDDDSLNKQLEGSGSLHPPDDNNNLIKQGSSSSLLHADNSVIKQGSSKSSSRGCLKNLYKVDGKLDTIHEDTPFSEEARCQPLCYALL